MVSHKTLVWSCYLVAFLDLFAVSMILPLFNRRGRELGASPSVVGLIGSIYGGIQFFSSPYMGKASDKWGRKPILLLSFVGCIAGYFTIGVTNTILFFALARLPTGILKHSMTSSRAYLSDITFPGERAGSLGRFNAVGSMGFMIGPIIGGYVSMQENGFFKACLLSCTVYVGAFIYVWFVFDKKIVKKKSEDSPTERSVGSHEIVDRSCGINTSVNELHINDKNEARKCSDANNKERGPSGMLKFFSFFKIESVRNVMDLMLLRFVMGFCIMVYRSNYTTMLDYRYGVDAKTTGYMISFSSVIGAISGMSVGRIYSLFRSDEQMMFFAALMMTCSLFGIVVSPTIYGILLCSIPLSLSTAVMRVNSHNLVLKRCRDDEKGAVMGFGDSVTSMARMLSPAIAGFAQEISVIGPCWFALILAVIGIGIIVIFLLGQPITDKTKKKE